LVPRGRKENKPLVIANKRKKKKTETAIRKFMDSTFCGLRNPKKRRGKGRTKSTHKRRERATKLLDGMRRGGLLPHR